MDMKLELVPVPVSDVDRAKSFYEKLGFHVDMDQRLGDDLRFVQLSPPGSSCSISLGEGITKQVPGTQDGLLLVVQDINAAYEELTQRGVEVSKPAMMPWGSTTPTLVTPMAIGGHFSNPLNGVEPPAVCARLHISLLWRMSVRASSTGCLRL